MGKKLSQQEFINRSIKMHNNKYDYSLVKYVHTSSKVIIICNIHGNFSQIAMDHLRGRGCAKCGVVQRADMRKKSITTFIEQSNKIHNHYYYTRVKYQHTLQLVSIICPVHGEFYQRPNDHLKGIGCLKCGIIKAQNHKHKITTEEIIKRFIKKHGIKYEYAKVSYKRSNCKVIVTCKKHGDFSVLPLSHAGGVGCMKCSATTSKSEEYMKKVLISKNILFEEQKTFPDLINPLTNRKLKYDFFLPNFNTIIELDGEQHFKPIRFKGMPSKNAEETFQKIVQRDSIKNDYAKMKGIHLLRIPYTSFCNIDNIIEQLTQ